MANSKISALTELTTAPATNDELAIVDTSAVATKHITKANFDLLNITANTVTLVLASTDNATAYTNENDTDGCDFTLPSAAVGLVFDFCLQCANTVTINAYSGDTIRIGTSVSSAITCTTIGAAVKLIAVNTTEWIGVSSQGTWSF